VTVVDAHLAGSEAPAAATAVSRHPAAASTSTRDMDGLSPNAIQELLRSQVDGILQPQGASGDNSIPRLTQTDSADMAQLAQLSDDDVTQMLLKEFAKLGQADQPEA
jgi:hypothetical protein